MSEKDTTAALLAEMRAELEALKAQKAAQSPGDRALELLATNSAPKDNPNYNEISAFTYPEGERVRPKPRLSRDTFFCGSRCRADELTPAEIDAFNAITSSKTVQKPNGPWLAEVRQNGTAQELHIAVPSRTIDDRMGLPSLLLILTEIQGGAAAVDPLALAQRVAELEKKLAAVA
jgi:hypothetical protein